MEVASNPIDIIYEIVEKHTGLSREEIAGPSRKPNIVKARSVVGVVLYKHTKLKLITIGAAINRDHSVIIRNNKEHETRMGFFEGYLEIYQAVNTGFLNAIETSIPQLFAKIEQLKGEIQERKDRRTASGLWRQGIS